MKKKSLELFFDFCAIFFFLFGAHLIVAAHSNQGSYFDIASGNLLSPLGDYPYPLHMDGWNHLSQTRSLVEEQSFSQVNPQLSGDYFHSSSEKGFHAFLGSIILFFSFDYVDLAIFIPAFIFILGLLCVYLFFSRVKKQSVTGLFVIFFLFFIPSDITMLGSWFLVPSVLSILFFACALYVLSFSFRKRIFLAGLLLLITLLTYPPVAVFVLFVFGVHFFVHFSDYKNDLKLFFRVKWHLFVSGVVGIGLLFVIISLSSHSVIFSPGWTNTPIAPSPLFFLGIPLIFFSLLGLFFLWTKEKFLFWLVASYSIFALGNSILFFISRYAVLLPFRRMLLFWAFICSLSAGFALFVLFKKIVHFIGVKKRNISFAKLSVFLALFLLLLFLYLPSYFVIDPEIFVLQKIVYEEQLELLDVLKTSESKVVLSDAFFSSAIFPSSGHKALFALDANLAGLQSNFYPFFLSSSCSDRWSLYKANHFDFIISSENVSCSFITPIKKSGEYTLFVVKPDAFKGDFND